MGLYIIYLYCVLISHKCDIVNDFLTQNVTLNLTVVSLKFTMLCYFYFISQLTSKSETGLVFILKPQTEHGVK